LSEEVETVSLSLVEDAEAAGLVTPLMVTVALPVLPMATGVVIVTVGLVLPLLVITGVAVTGTAMPGLLAGLTVYAEAAVGKLVPFAAPMVMVPEPAESAPELLVVKPTL
jgi:hypothetical protein